MTDKQALIIAKRTIEKAWGTMSDAERKQNLEIMEAVGKINIMIEFQQIIRDAA